MKNGVIVLNVCHTTRNITFRSEILENLFCFLRPRFLPSIVVQTSAVCEPLFTCSASDATLCGYWKKIDLLFVIGKFDFEIYVRSIDNNCHQWQSNFRCCLPHTLSHKFKWKYSVVLWLTFASHQMRELPNWINFKTEREDRNVEAELTRESHFGRFETIETTQLVQGDDGKDAKWKWADVCCVSLCFGFKFDCWNPCIDFN